MLLLCWLVVLVLVSCWFGILFVLWYVRVELVYVMGIGGVL